MKRIVYGILLCVLFIVQPVKANHTISQWFALLPDSVMPLLTRNNRLDLIDFKACGMEATVTNRMDGNSCMSILTDNYLHLNYTASTDVEMKLLTLNDSTDVICVVTTVDGTVKDSRISFYDVEWKPLDMNSFFNKPTLRDFYPANSKVIAELLWQKVDVFFCTYHLSADTTALECRLTSIDNLFSDDKDLIMTYLGEQTFITYSWLEGKFCKDE